MTTPQLLELTPKEEAALNEHTKARAEIALTDEVTAGFDGEDLILSADGQGYHLQIALDENAIRTLMASPRTRNEGWPTSRGHLQTTAPRALGGRLIRAPGEGPKRRAFK